MKSRTGHIAFLDSLRGFAIVSVFLLHCLTPAFGFDQLEWHGWWRDFHAPRAFLLLLPATLGWAGVYIFFVISGFCIHLSYCNQRTPSWGDFFARRFFRIYPPYLLAMLFFACLFPLTRLRLETSYARGQLVSHLLLFHNLTHKFFLGINGSFWSIGTEVQLYAIYPLVVYLTRRLGWKIALGLIAAIEIGMRSLFAATLFIPQLKFPAWFLTSPFSYWFCWTIGAAVAERFRLAKPPPTTARWWMWILLLAVLSNFVGPVAVFTPPLLAIATAAWIAHRMSHPAHRRSPSALNKLLARIGIWSYSLYLLHQPLVNWLGRWIQAKWAGQIPPLVVFVLLLAAFPVLVGLSAIYYRQIEQRSIAVGRWVIDLMVALRRQVDPNVSGIPVAESDMPRA